MKNIILFYLFLLLASCIKPQESSTIPSENSDFTIEKSPEIDSIKIIKESITLEFSNKSDKKSFIKFLKDEGTNSFSFKSFTDKTDVLSVEPLDNTLSIIEDENWGESDIIPSFKFDSNSKISIISQFSRLSSPLKLLKFYSLDKAYPLSLSNNIATIKLDSSSNSLSKLEQWNSFAKEYPATFKALLGDVIGLPALVSQKEERLSGISPLSPTEISVKLKPNSKSINNPLICLLPGIDGRYKRDKNNLIYNGNITTPHIKSIEIKSLSNSDPIIEFSMGKADGLLIYKSDDISLIKNKFKDCKLTPVDTINLFISISNKISKEKRLSLLGTINSKDIFNQLSVEGKLIDRIIKTSQKPPFVISSTGPNSFDSSLVIIYDGDNQLSKQTAVALKNSLLKGGVKSRIDSNLEKNLYNGTYDIAIGTLNSSIKRYDPNGEFISRLFFNGDINEDNRIYDGFEKPLFMATIYLVLKEPFIIPYNKVENITKRASLVK